MRIFLFCLLVFLSACSDSPEPAQTTVVPAKSADYRIGHYMSPAEGLYSNSYWIEGPQGLVLIGAQFLPTQALRAVEVAQSYTGKKVQMVIVLDPDPAQANGIGALKQQGLRVVTSDAVNAHIAAAHQRDLALYGDDYADYPRTATHAESAWQKTQLFDAVGLQFKVYVIRQGQSRAHLLIALEDHLFVGDLIANQHHSDLRLGRSDDWLERLDEMARFAKPRVVHPGRGYAMAGADLIRQQRDYLQAFRKAVAAEYSGGEITEADIKLIQERMVKAYPDYLSSQWLGQGVRAEWQSLHDADHEMMMKSTQDDD